MPAPGGEPAARRLVLSATELALLVDTAGMTLPPGFSAGQADEPALRQAAAALTERGVVEADAGSPLPAGTGGGGEPRRPGRPRHVRADRGVGARPWPTRGVRGRRG